MMRMGGTPVLKSTVCPLISAVWHGAVRPGAFSKSTAEASCAHVIFAAMRTVLSSLLTLTIATALGCAGATTSAPTAAEASAFLGTVNATMRRLGVEQNQAGWV